MFSTTPCFVRTIFITATSSFLKSNGTKLRFPHICYYRNSARPLSNYRYFQTCIVNFKRRKTKEETDIPKVFKYPEKSSREPVGIWLNMTVEELANALEKPNKHVFEALSLINGGHIYTKPKSVIDNVAIMKEIVKKSGRKFNYVARPSQMVAEVVDNDVERQPAPDPGVLVKRPPVVTVMGHVDHGKTTLLDYLSNRSVVETEFGGITQHIGAFSVKLKSGDLITFLDTPGHAAFSAMRARGANVTDIVVLVVAADDGVMEQTVESIKMANNAGVPVIVALNKIDKPTADIEGSKRMLLKHGIRLEDDGGDVQLVPISALKGTNIDTLEEAIVLQAELMNLRGDPQGLVEGFVIESNTDVHRGKLSTALIKRGTLKKGSVIVAGTAWARVRSMFDHSGNPVHEAPPSTPVQVVGWRELPSAGDEILEVESERRAASVVRWREQMLIKKKQEEDEVVIKDKVEEHVRVYKKELEERRKLGRYRKKRVGQREKEIKEDDGSPRLNIIIKGDVDGSVEAILDVLETYNCNNLCKLDIVHYGVGNVVQTDLELAQIFNAVVYAFNTKTPSDVKQLSKQMNVEIKDHNVIYRLVDDIKQEINGRLPNKQVEQVLGEANVLQLFIVNVGKKKIPVAGCRCVKGELKKSSMFKLVRNGKVLHTGMLDSMRHLKEEVQTIKNGVECGLMFAGTGVPEFVPGDVMVCYQLVDVPQTIAWDPGF